MRCRRLITDPAEIAETAGSLHCGTLLLAKLIKKYLGGAEDMRLAVTVKGCDAMGIYELAKRNQVNLDNIFMIGVNCGGSVSPVSARKMIREKFGVDPDDVVKEEIDKGQFIIVTKAATQGHLDGRTRRGRLRPPVQLPPLQDEDPAPGRPCLR